MKRQVADAAMETRLAEPIPTEFDPVIEALVREIIGQVADKWTMLILEVLEEHGTLRFTQVGKHVGGISQKMLTQTLRQMERDGLATRTVEATAPVAVTYAITPLGLTLVQALQPMIDWAETRMPEVVLAQAGYDAAQTR